MNAITPVLRMDQDISLSEALDLLDQVSFRLGIYAKATRDLSWNVVTAADLVSQARQYTARAIREASCE